MAIKTVIALATAHQSICIYVSSALQLTKTHFNVSAITCFQNLFNLFSIVNAFEQELLI